MADRSPAVSAATNTTTQTPLPTPVPWLKNVRVYLFALRVLSVLCVVIGVTWLFMLPLNEYSRETYISENALLPGQVHTYFHGSEQNIFRAYKKEVEALADAPRDEMVDKIASILRDSGLKVGKQKYSYTTAGEVHAGENVYAIMHAPRGDATEAIVLVAPMENIDHLLNDGGVALTLTLARYFRRWSLWSKDIIFLISADARAGPQAWVDAYHDQHTLPNVASLPIKSGALQGVVVVDFPNTYPRFDALHVVYDGVNGQLPNLDLINTAVQIASGQMGIKTTFQEMWHHDDHYKDRLRTMLRGMVNQGLGHSSGAHSSFIPYHIDAITLQAYGDGWQDEMALGRTVESLFRSLNNLLEHFHQSFFFYLLMAPRRFVSIGTYLPSAMLVAVGFTLTAIRLWIESGRTAFGDKDHTLEVDLRESETGVAEEKQGLLAQGVSTGKRTLPYRSSLAPGRKERDLFVPLSIVLGLHFFGVVPFSIFNTIDHGSMATGFYILLGVSIVLPLLLSLFITTIIPQHKLVQTFQLSKSFSLLILGMCLSALATLNFSLSFLIGVFSFPLSFATPLPNHPPVAILMSIIMLAMSPFTALIAVGQYWNLGVGDILNEAAFGWGVWGMWTPVVVWVVWYPAWLIACTSIDASLILWIRQMQKGMAAGIDKAQAIQAKRDVSGKKETLSEKIVAST